MAYTYYTCLSGMLAASYGLQNTSSNVANMQTSGFKKTDVFYSSLTHGDDDLGAGVQVKGFNTNFSKGKYFSSNNATDLAIIGNSFFIIKLKNNELAYTRSGEFRFDAHGILIDQHTGGEVQGYDKAGNLVAIHQTGPKNAPGKPSHHLFLQGSFVAVPISEEEQKQQPEPIKKKFENVSFEVAQVYDQQGKSHVVRLEFEASRDEIALSEGLTWKLVNISWDGNQEHISYQDQNIVFSGFGTSAAPEANTIRFSLKGEQIVTLHLGNYTDGSKNNVQLEKFAQITDQTKIDVLQNDGYGIGQQVDYMFNEDGQLIYRYDNEQEIKGVYVGLALFNNVEHQLTPLQNGLFKAGSNCSVRIGRANQDGFGSVGAKQIESSNVDSTLEFANIVVLQRMFQACSQIMNIDKQLLEELEGRS